MHYSFLTYDNTTTSIQLPPILQQQSDRYYLPKSASFNSPSPSYKNNTNSLSNIILQQNYYPKKKKKSTKKRLNISTSTSSSSLSSSNSVDDIVTPTTNEYTPYTKSIMWLDPILYQPHHI